LALSWVVARVGQWAYSEAGKTAAPKAVVLAEPLVLISVFLSVDLKVVALAALKAVGWADL